MLQGANMRRDEMFKPFIDRHKIARLLACDEQAIRWLRYIPEGIYRGEALEVLGHRMPNGAVRWKHPAFCPRCVLEEGYHAARWDFRYLIACARHRRMLVDRCSACGRRLTWFRPGLLRCSCGAELREDRECPSDDVQELMEVLIAKLEGDEVNDLGAGLPLMALAGMSLHTIVRITIHLAQQYRLSMGWGRTIDPDMQVMHVAALLRHWPQHFHEMLLRLGRNYDRDAVGLRGQFASFCNSLFRTVLPQDEVRFIKEAFVEFGLHHWGKGFVHRSWLRGMEDLLPGAKFVTENLATEIESIPSSAIRRMRAANSFAYGVASCPTHRAILVSRESLRQAFAEESAKVAGRRSAAAALGVSEAMLVALTKRRWIRPARRHANGDIYRVADLEALRRRMFEGCRTVVAGEAPGDALPLKAVLMRKCMPLDVRLAVLEELLTNRRRFDAINDRDTIWIPRSMVEGVQRELAKAVTPGGVSIWRAASRIGCSVAAVLPLAKSGHLRRLTPRARVFTDPSIEAFKRRYVALTQVSRRFEIPLRQLRDTCRQLDTARIEISANGCATTQIFVEKPWVDGLVVACGAKRFAFTAWSAVDETPKHIGKPVVASLRARSGKRQRVSR